MEFFWNIYNFWEEKSTQDGARGGHEAGGRASPPPRGAPDPRAPPVWRLVPFFRRKKANIRIEIVLKFQPNWSYGSPGI